LGRLVGGSDMMKLKNDRQEDEGETIKAYQCQSHVSAGLLSTEI